MANTVTGNYFYSLLNTISSFLFPLIAFPYVARILYADGIGLVNFYSSIVSYISLFVSIGIPYYAVRQIARVRDNTDEMSRQVVEIIVLNLILVIIGYLIVFFLAIFVPRVHENMWLFLLLSINIIFVAIGCDWFYQGIEDFKYITIRALIVRIVCVILLFLFVHDRDDLMFYGAYSVFGVVGNNIFNLIRLRKYINLSTININSLNPWKHFFPSIQVFGLTLISSLYLNLDTVMLGFMTDNYSVGYYTGAIRITKILMGVATALGTVILPRLSNMAVNENLDEFKKLVEKSIHYVIALSLPMIIGLMVMAPILIHVFCGNNYEPSILCVIIMAPIILFISISYIISQAFYPLNMMRQLYIRACISAITNLIANICLIPFYAQYGAAIGTLLAEFVALASSIYMFKNIVKISLINKSNVIYLFASILMGIIIMIVGNVFHNEMLQLFLMPISGVIVYYLILRSSHDDFLQLITQKMIDIFNLK